MIVSYDLEFEGSLIVKFVPEDSADCDFLEGLIEKCGHFFRWFEIGDVVIFEAGNLRLKEIEIVARKKT